MEIRTIVDIVAIAFFVWFIFTRFAGVRGLKNVTSDQLQEELNHPGDYKLIDVREPGEVRQGFIPGAVNIPLSQIKRRAGEIPRDARVYLYCRSGMRSRQAARVLKGLGFSQLAHLQGGMMSWKGKVTK
ncbi:rhodanese-like domain-containing protein [Paenibacillus hexagrammi]|uniref:Rhodanese-like domain-containing protein n=1 Tax=Paenibacillus hexagrammi TaxID=2908839 RepID=A0ABY3SIN0_9BACL|nr:rhodanese-like domain-containing protein [Paenibacillus sp. YPD9-1]UJF33863.1 rhodanese-like domain-containing protein [Paenibacillus sp. YPD9-1]